MKSKEAALDNFTKHVDRCKKCDKAFTGKFKQVYSKLCSLGKNLYNVLSGPETNL